MNSKEAINSKEHMKRTYVIQNHHLAYQRKDKVKVKTGETVRLYKGEHWAITLMQRRKYISKGFIRALEFWIEQHREGAISV